MRPGRFDRVLYVPLPDLSTRTKIFTIKLGQMPVEETVSVSWLAEGTQGYSGAEVSKDLLIHVDIIF